MISCRLEDLPSPPPAKLGWPWTEISPVRSWSASRLDNLPKVSVITPSYNQARFLEETIRSVLLQNYPNLEYIIIDGGSQDGTLEIIQRYAPWLSYWVSEEDHGQGDALNKGLRVANGVYIGWLNSDDLYLPGLLNDSVAYLVENPEVSVVYRDCLIVDDHSAVIGRSDAREFDLQEYLKHDYIAQQTALIRKVDLDDIGGINPSLHYHLDYDLFLRLSRKFFLQKLPGEGGCFRVHAGTKSVTTAKGFAEEGIRILDSFYTSGDITHELLKTRPQAYGWAYLHGALRLYGNGQVDLAKEYLQRSIEVNPGWWAEENEALNHLIGWASYPVIGDPLRYIHSLFNHLPSGAVGLRRRKREALARAGMWLCLENRTWMAQLPQQERKIKENRRIARKGWLLAVYNRPRWLANMDWLSVGVEVFLGSRLHSSIRTIIRGIRAGIHAVVQKTTNYCNHSFYARRR
jgi:glycosyltransferase involved in cell wall biosynthesis